MPSSSFVAIIAQPAAGRGQITGGSACPSVSVRLLIDVDGDLDSLPSLVAEAK